MKYRILSAVLFLVCFGVIAVVYWSRPEASVATIEVHFKLTDKDYQPVPGVPLRIVLGEKDWQSPDAGTRLVTDANGQAVFITTSIIDKRIVWDNVGFTPFSLPKRVDHLSLAAELETVLPQKGGEDVPHRWLYTAEIYHYPDGDCSTDGLVKIYEAATDKRFTTRLGEGIGQNFKMNIGGLVLSGMRYQLWDYRLSASQADAHWSLKLGLMRMPKAVIR